MARKYTCNGIRKENNITLIALPQGVHPSFGGAGGRLL